MSTTERRRCLTAAVAVIAVAAAVALAPESSAKGGPGKSPFAGGSYGWVTGSYYGNTWAVTISDKGQIAGSLVAGYGYSKGSLGGRVNGDGSYSFTMSLTAPIFDDGDPDAGGHYQHAAPSAAVRACTTGRSRASAAASKSAGIRRIRLTDSVISRAAPGPGITSTRTKRTGGVSRIFGPREQASLRRPCFRFDE